jgi:hypothetical protein
MDVLTAWQWDDAGVTSLPVLVETLDYLSLDVIYLVSVRSVDVLIPLWLGIPTVAETDVSPSTGVLIRVESRRALSRLRTQSRWLKELLGTAVEQDMLTPVAARQCLSALYTRPHGWRCLESPATCTLTSQHLP